MEQWQLEALQQLLDTPIKQVEEKRIYTSSQMYGTSRYHLIEKRYDSVQIEQINVDEQWSKRVNLFEDELPAVLKTLLLWHLDDVRQKQEIQASDSDDNVDDLDDLDEKPF